MSPHVICVSFIAMRALKQAAPVAAVAPVVEAALENAPVAPAAAAVPSDDDDDDIDLFDGERRRIIF